MNILAVRQNSWIYLTTGPMMTKCQSGRAWAIPLKVFIYHPKKLQTRMGNVHLVLGIFCKRPSECALSMLLERRRRLGT